MSLKPAVRIWRVSQHVVSNGATGTPNALENPNLDMHSITSSVPSPTGSRIFGPWPHSLLLQNEGRAREALLREWKRLRKTAIAAMYPSRMGHASREDTPLKWTAEEWSAAEARQREEPIFNKAKLEAELTAQAGCFERDGYLVLPGVMTASATRRWVQSLQRTQELNDRLLRLDWASEIDWPALGWERGEPPEGLTGQMIARATGGAQRLAPQTTDNGLLLLRQMCVLPEYFPPAHDGHMMRCLFHPEILDLQRRLLGANAIYIDNIQLSNKVAPYDGGGWHVHGTGLAGSGHVHAEQCDNTGLCADVKQYMAQPCICLMLVYPEGMNDVDGGNINIIRGSHLFRDVQNLRGPSGEQGDAFLRGERTDADFSGQGGWLRGRRHPFTGQPLRTERLTLPPGTAHRLACQWFFMKASDRTGMTNAPASCPPLLSLLAAEGELPPTLAEVLRNSFDPALTNGCTAHNTYEPGSVATISTEFLVKG